MNDQFALFYVLFTHLSRVGYHHTAKPIGAEECLGTDRAIAEDGDGQFIILGVMLILFHQRLVQRHVQHEVIHQIAMGINRDDGR